MSDPEKILKEFFEDAPLYTPIMLPGDIETRRSYKLREIQAHCLNCNESKPFHNKEPESYVLFMEKYTNSRDFILKFECVTCKESCIKYWVTMAQIDDANIQFQKIGQDPQKELPRNKELSKFFKKDKDDYNKAVVCLTHGYGVAAFAYMRRIVEKNILSLLDLIAEDESIDETVKEALQSLRKESSMADKIKVANNALPGYLKPDGINPLGAIYKVLSEGVHSLPDEKCLEKANILQNCLLFMISELASHKRNRENFKKSIGMLSSI